MVAWSLKVGRLKSYQRKHSKEQSMEGDKEKTDGCPAWCCFFQRAQTLQRVKQIWADGVWNTVAAWERGEAKIFLTGTILWLTKIF